MLKTIIVRNGSKDVVHIDKNNDRPITSDGARHFVMTNAQLKSVSSSTGKKIKGSD